MKDLVTISKTFQTAFTNSLFLANKNKYDMDNNIF